MEYQIRSTTILGVRRKGQIALGGDGQVTFGDMAFKQKAVKVRKFESEKGLKIKIPTNTFLTTKYKPSSTDFFDDTITIHTFFIDFKWPILAISLLKLAFFISN